MEFHLSINTIKKSEESRFKEKGSIFIGQAYPISSSDEAENILSRIRKHYYDATHNCYAFKLVGDENVKYSDDGEPNGTAGIRILNAISHFELSNVLIISTRYFGGTKLGVGPLGKAYYYSAIKAIEASKIIKKENFSETIIEFNYDMTSNVHHFLKKFGAMKIENLFEEKPKIRCLMRKDLVSQLSAELELISKSSIKIDVLDDNIYLELNSK